jgi:hypothetical protein
MSATALATASGKPAGPKQEFDPIKFDPRPLFSRRKVKLYSSSDFPAHLPRSFVLTPEVERGNIKLTVGRVKFNSPPPHPTWRFREGTVNGSDAVSIVMEDNKGDLLVLTGDIGDPYGPENTWNSKVAGSVAQGTWSWRQLEETSTFSDHFSWTFLLDPGQHASKDDPVTVILEFDICVSETGGILQQISSFPPNWKASDFQFNDDGSMSMELTYDSRQKYVLTNGFFTGGLGALVCQGDMQVISLGSVLDDGKGNIKTISTGSVLASGNWTGTSGGPPSPG